MKKTFLRLLSSALFLATVFSTLIFTIHSDSTTPITFLMKHDFNNRISATNNITDSYVFNGWNGNSEIGLAVHENNSADKYMTWKRTTAEASPQLNLFMDADQISSDTARSIVVSFRMNFHTFGRFKAMLADVDGKWSTFFYLNDSGVMSTRADGTGDVLATLTADTWYTVAAVVDETEKRSTVYLNGEQIGTVNMNASHTYLKRLQLSFEKISGSGLAEVWLDNLYMYEGTKPLADADLPQPPQPEDPKTEIVPLGGLNFDGLTVPAETDTWVWNRISEETAQLGFAKAPNEETNQYLTWKKLSAGTTTEMNFFLDEDKVTSTPRSIVASFKLCIAQADDLRITLADVNGAFSDVLFISANGKVQTFGNSGPVVTTAEEGIWYTVSFVINEGNKTVTLYWNGVNLGKTTCHANHTFLKRLKISMIGTGSETVPELWLDDVTFYEAEEPVEKNDEPIVNPGEDDGKEIPYELYFNYNWDDNDRVVNDSILTYSKWGADTYFTVVKKDGDNALLFEREESNPRLDFKFGALQAASRYVISYSFFVVDHNFGYTEFTLYDGSVWNYMFQIDAEGNLRKQGYEGDSLVTITSDEWHTMDLLIDDKTNTYTLLYDGTELLKDTEFNSPSFGNAFRFLYTFTGNKPGSAQVYLDDFRMYAGDKVVAPPKPEDPPIVNPPVTTAPTDTATPPAPSGSETTTPGETTEQPGAPEAGCKSSLSGTVLILLTLLSALAVPLSDQFLRKRKNR